MGGEQEPQITEVKESAKDGPGWKSDHFDVYTKSLRLECNSCFS